MTWFLIGAALLVVPGRRRPVRGVHRSRRLRDAASAPSLQVACGVGVGVIALMIVGGRAGVLAAVAAGSLGGWLVGRVGTHATSFAAAELDSVPLVLDLVATALRVGLPVDAALTAGAEAAGPLLRGELRRISGLLRLGSSPEPAWSRFADDPQLRPIAVVAARSADSGIRLADGWLAAARQLRLDAAAAAMTRSARIGTWSMAPLGLCFLPAFVCVGVAPTVIGLASGLVRGGLL